MTYEWQRDAAKLVTCMKDRYIKAFSHADWLDYLIMFIQILK